MTDFTENIKQPLDLLIVGGGPGGMSAALYAARARLNALAITDGGGQVTATAEIENYLGIDNVDGFELDRLFTEHAKRMGAEVLTARVDKIEKNGNLFTATVNDKKIDAKTVIIAAGATHRELGVEGEKRLFGAGVSYCATCDGAFFRNKRVAVIGGGDTALSDALYLSSVASKVYLIHRRDKFRASQFLTDRAASRENIKFIYSTVVNEIEGEDRVTGIALENLSNGNKGNLEVDGVFIAVGIKPNNSPDFVKVNTDKSGFIIAGEDCKTSVDGIFAVGDIRTKPLRQIVCAVSDGAVAVESVRDYLEKLEG